MRLFKSKESLIEHPERYSQEECEIVALICSQAFATKSVKDTLCTIRQRAIAWLDVSTGEIHRGFTSLCWNEIYKDKKPAKIRYYFKKLTCCRLIVRKNIEYTTDFTNEKKLAGSELFVMRVLKKNYHDKRLDDMLAEYLKTITLTLSDGSMLTLDKEHGEFEGNVKWLDSDVSLHLDEDSSGSWTADLALKHFLIMYSNQAEWTDKIKKYAAQEMTESANDWQEDEDDELPEITEKAFAERIKLDLIAVEPNGDYTFWFDDDEMFWGHTVVVQGNIDGSFDRADIWG